MVDADKKSSIQPVDGPSKIDQALELRKRRVSLIAIASKLQYSNCGALRSALRSELAKRLGVPTDARDDINVELELEIMSLDDMEAKLWLVLDGADADTTMKGSERIAKIKAQRADLLRKRRWEDQDW